MKGNLKSNEKIAIAKFQMPNKFQWPNNKFQTQLSIRNEIRFSH
jgi:hypothetical protein